MSGCVRILDIIDQFLGCTRLVAHFVRFWRILPELAEFQTLSPNVGRFGRHVLDWADLGRFVSNRVVCVILADVMRPQVKPLGFT